MIGLGTIINVIGIIAGGLFGKLFGKLEEAGYYGCLITDESGEIKVLQK